MKKNNLWKILLAAALIVALFTAVCLTAVKSDDSDITSLNVVTMPLLVNTDYARSLLAEMWAEIEPGIELNFVDRGYGSTKYPEDIDVLTFDFENIGYLSSLGYFREIKPRDIEALDSLIPFARENLFTNGKIYGVPQFVCGNYLVYHKGDAELDRVSNILELCDVLAKGNTEGLPIKEDADKVWIDFGYQYAYYALDAILDVNGSYVPFNEVVVNRNLPEVYDIFDYVRNWSIETESGDIDPAAFGDGRGRAIICFTEKVNMTGLNPEELTVKAISFSDGPDIPLTYMDSVAISDWVKDDARYEKCLELVNLMTSREYIERLLTYEGKPQYLLPAREDVFREYAAQYPLYAQMYDRMVSGETYQFRGNADNLNLTVKSIKAYQKQMDEAA